MDNTSQVQNISPLHIVGDTLDADIFLFSGPLYRVHAEALIEEVEKARDTKRTNAALILTTLGGDADAAYIIARTLRANYELLHLYVFGPCKSAGTLIALGANSIIMSRRGELGPLDVQLITEDEIVRRSSGLNIFKALNSLNEQCYGIWEKHFLEIVGRSYGTVTTKTAADIASSLATGLIAPITAQIDPFKLGEVERSIQIATEYGLRLGAHPSIVDRLVRAYPSHSFVIDIEEAQTLFPDVRYPSLVEYELERVLREALSIHIPFESIREQHPEGIVSYLELTKESQNEQPTQEQPEDIPEQPQSPEPDGAGGLRSTSDSQAIEEGRSERAIQHNGQSTTAKNTEN